MKRTVTMEMKPRVPRSAALALLTAGALLLFGCAGVNYGTMRHSAEVSAAFDGQRLLPGYTWYSSGVINKPEAILGVRNGFTLESDVWQRANLNQRKLGTWVANMNRNLETADRPAGYVLYTPDGREAGVWYSRYRWTSLKVTGDDTLVIGLPGPLEDERLQRRRGR